MKSIRSAIVVSLLFIPSLSCAQQKKPSDAVHERLLAQAQTMLRFLEAKQYDSCVTLFDSSLQSQLTPELLRDRWGTTQDRLGALLHQDGARFDREAGYQIVYLPCTFEKQTIDMKVVFNDAGHIVGFFAVPPHTGEKYELPEYAHPDSLTQKTETVVTDTFTLGATLTIPKNVNDPPIVVMVAGSGPNDRNEKIKSNEPFADLAYGLANFGIATLRYDKRTQAYGVHATADYADLTPDQEVVNDALSALKLARTIPGVDHRKVFLLGHSLGAMMAPRIAARDGKVAGIVYLAAPARPFQDVILDQMEFLVPQQTSKDKADAELVKIRSMTQQIAKHEYTDTTSYRELFNLPPKYWDYLRSYDQVKTAESLKMPMLFLRGDKDYQVSQKDYDLWQKALGGHSNVTFHEFPGLFHLFMPGGGTYTDYDTPGHVTPEVIDTIGSWIRSH